MSSVQSVSVAASFVQQGSGLGRGGSCSAASQMQSKFERAVIDAGGSNVDLGTLQSQIQSAVQGVLDNSSNAGDPQLVRSQVQQAIDTTLKQNGIDPDKLKSEMQPVEGGSNPFSHGTALTGAGNGINDTLQTDETSIRHSFSFLLDSLTDSSKSSSAGQPATSGFDSSANSANSVDDLLQELVKHVIQNLPIGSSVNTSA